MVERNSVDVAAAVKTLMAASPDVVVQFSAHKSHATFIREGRKAGFGGTFFNVSFAGRQALTDELGKGAAGVVVSQVVPSPYTSTRTITREFAEAVKKAGGGAGANVSSLDGYLAARVVTKSLGRAGHKGATREGLVRGIEALGNQSLRGFNMQFSASKHLGSSFLELSMLTGDGRVRT